MEINAYKTTYADGIARICAYQQSRRHVYLIARSRYISSPLLYLSFAYLAGLAEGAKLVSGFCFPHVANQSIMSPVSAWRKRERETHRETERKGKRSIRTPVYSRLSFVVFNIVNSAECCLCIMYTKWYRYQPFRFPVTPSRNSSVTQKYCFYAKYANNNQTFKSPVCQMQSYSARHVSPWQFARDMFAMQQEKHIFAQIARLAAALEKWSAETQFLRCFLPNLLFDSNAFQLLNNLYDTFREYTVHSIYVLSLSTLLLKRRGKYIDWRWPLSDVYTLCHDGIFGPPLLWVGGCTPSPFSLLSTPLTRVIPPSPPPSRAKLAREYYLLLFSLLLYLLPPSRTPSSCWESTRVSRIHATVQDSPISVPGPPGSSLFLI
jgi:hypothetical protein